LDLYNLYNYIKIILAPEYVLNDIYVDKMSKNFLNINSELTIKNRITHNTFFQYIYNKIFYYTKSNYTSNYDIQTILDNIRENNHEYFETHDLLNKYIYFNNNLCTNNSNFYNLYYLYDFFNLSLIFYYEFYKKYKGKLTIEDLEKTDILYLIPYKNPILFTIILVLCCNNKVEKDNSFDNKSNKILFYKKYILSLNLMHSDYNDIIYLFSKKNYSCKRSFNFKNHSLFFHFIKDENVSIVERFNTNRIKCNN
jgi:hypothetical protein